MVRPLNSKERKELLHILIEQFGFTGPFDYTIFVSDDEKYYLATRAVEEYLGTKMRIERIGTYFAQLQHGELRFSIEGAQIVGPHATKHVIEITPAERGEWMLGKDIIVHGEYPQRFHIVKCAEDYLGCGKIKNGMIFNYVPKERYIGATFTDEDVIDEAESASKEE